MDIKKIKAEVAHLPHVTKVWIKDNAIFLSKVHKAKEISLAEQNEESADVEAEAETEAPTPKKKK